MIDLLSLRGLLFLEALTCLLLFFSLAGSLWMYRHWPVRLSYVGGLLLLSYVTSIQVKAYKRGAPFDGYSWLGLVGVTVTIIGLAWWIGRLHIRGRG